MSNMKQCILYMIMLSLALSAINMVAFSQALATVADFTQTTEIVVQWVGIENKKESSVSCHQKTLSQNTLSQQMSAQSSVSSKMASHDCCSDTVSFEMTQYCEHENCNDCNSEVSPPFALLTHYLKSDFANAGITQSNSKQIPINPYEQTIVPPIS